MRLADIRTLLATVATNWPIEPGPSDLNAYPGPFIIATPYGGPGVDTDGVTDRMSWQFRVIGRQSDYESAETMARAIDTALLSLPSSRITNGPWVISVTRIGGPPSTLLRDNAKRTHFICSYIFEHESALVN